LSKQEIEKRESYAETTQFKILDWYLDIGRSMARAGSLLDYVFQSRRMDNEALQALYEELITAKNGLVWFPHTLFTKEDIEKVLSYRESLDRAKQRKERRPIAQDIDEAKRSYLQSRLDLQDEYAALTLQMDSVRKIMADNKWFELTKRPAPREHSTNLRYSK
jgi:hypothetical protein